MDIVVLLVICCVMHGLAMLAVETQCRLQQPSVLTGLVVPQTPSSRTDRGSRG